MTNRESNSNDQQTSIDRGLTSAENRKIAEVVKHLPQDEVSMAWRSSLNEKLNESVRVSAQNKRMWHRFWGYTTGLGVSGAVVASVLFIMMGRAPDTPNIVSEGSLEAQLYAAHNETTRSTDVAGPGLALCDETDNARETRNVQWNEEDLEAL